MSKCSFRNLCDPRAQADSETGRGPQQVGGRHTADGDSEGAGTAQRIGRKVCRQAGQDECTSKAQRWPAKPNRSDDRREAGVDAGEAGVAGKFGIDRGQPSCHADSDREHDARQAPGSPLGLGERTEREKSQRIGPEVGAAMVHQVAGQPAPVWATLPNPGCVVSVGTDPTGGYGNAHCEPGNPVRAGSHCGRWAMFRWRRAPMMSPSPASNAAIQLWGRAPAPV